MVLAVLDRRARVPVGASDAYLSTVGGVRLGEPAADLAIALSVASSVADRPLPPHAVAFGEVGLAGELRPASGMPRRLTEAARLGSGPRSRRAASWVRPDSRRVCESSRRPTWPEPSSLPWTSPLLARVAVRLPASQWRQGTRPKSREREGQGAWRHPSSAATTC